METCTDNRVGRLEALLRVGQRLSSEMNLDRLLGLILDETTRVMNADRSTLFLVDSDRGELWSKIAQATSEIRIPIGKGIAGAVARNGECVNIPDAYADPRFNPEVDHRTGYTTRSILCVPMKNPAGETIGVIQVLNKVDGAFDGDDEEMLLALAGQAAVAVQNARYHESSLREVRMKKDLEFAATIQEGFLPARLPKFPGFAFAARYQPAQEVGGDFYDFIPLPEGRLGVLVGDVSGKGVPAALFMARLMSDFRFYATGVSSASEVVGRVNEVVAERSLRGMFVTLSYLQLESDGKAILVNAGHLPPLVRRAGGRVVVVEGGSNPPVGILAGHEFEEKHFEINPGETLLMITDGITESMDGKGRQFGAARVRSVLKETAGAEAGARSVMDDVKAFVGSAPRHDDLTLVSIERKKTGAKKARAAAVQPRGEDLIHLRVKSDPRFLALVRRNLEFLLAADEVLDQDMPRIILAVDEAAANVIRYAYGGRRDKTIEFDFEVSPRWLTIHIRDYGKKPDLEAIKPRPLDEIRPGGLGTRFMSEVMDEVSYDTTPEVGTILTMKKSRVIKGRV